MKNYILIKKCNHLLSKVVNMNLLFGNKEKTAEWTVGK